MTKRHVHYESAFEAFLCDAGVPHVPVDESRRIALAGEEIKSFDFLVYPPGGPNWIADVKGRRFPYAGGGRAPRYWENWVIQADLDSLAEWQFVFGDGFEARFVFAYRLEGDPERWPEGEPFVYLGNSYTFYSVTLEAYRRHCRVRSSRWETVSVAAEVFRRIASPVRIGLSASPAEPARAASSP